MDDPAFPLVSFFLRAPHQFGGGEVLFLFNYIVPLSVIQHAEISSATI